MTTAVKRLALTALALSSLAAPASLAADGSVAATGLGGGSLARGPRTVDVILADVAHALASDEAWKAHKNMRMKLEMAYQGMGIHGQGERFATKDDKALVVTDMPGMGTIREGSNGKVTWAQDPINGARRLSGAEAEQARIEDAWNLELRMNELYKTIELAPSSPPGQECLVLTPSQAPVVTNCYDAKTHLQVSQKGTRSTPQGDLPFSSTLKDWREVGGLKFPFAIDTQAGPMTFTLRLSDVKFDEPMDEKMFEPPGGQGADAKGEAAKGKAKGKPKGKPKSKTTTP
jgi:hypothetical protein